MRKQKPLLRTLFSSALCGLLVSVFIGHSLCNPRQVADVNERTVSFDGGWHFLKNDITDAKSPDFDDSNRRILDVPNDWSIEDLPRQNVMDIIGLFNKSATDRGSTGYLVGGIGWYKKSFSISKEDKS